MVSRKEQKERARAERIAREDALAAARARRRRLSLTGGLIALAAVAVVIAVVASGGGTNRTHRPGPRYQLNG